MVRNCCDIDQYKGNNMWETPFDKTSLLDNNRVIIIFNLLIFISKFQAVTSGGIFT